MEATRLDEEIAWTAVARKGWGFKSLCFLNSLIKARNSLPTIKIKMEVIRLDEDAVSKAAV